MLPDAAKPITGPTRDFGAAPRKRDRAVLALAALLLAAQIGPWYYEQRDAAKYLSIARHLAHGGVQCMDHPFLWYPPGYPMVISPLFCVRELPLLEISIVHWFLAIAILLGIYRWARLLTEEGAVWIAAIGVGTCSVWIVHRQPISETAFMAAMAWLLVSLQALARPQSRGHYLGWLAAAAGLGVAVCLARLAGMGIVAGGCFGLLAVAGRNRFFPGRRPSEVVAWRPALVAAFLIGAAAAISVGGVLLHQRFATQSAGDGTYLAELEAGVEGQVLDSFGARVAWAVSEIGRNTIPGMFKSYGNVGWWRDINMLVYIPCFALLLFGGFRWARRGDDPLVWALPFYFAVLIHFRGDSGGRWWVPITPLVFVCLWFALESWSQRRKVLRAIWVAHVLVASVYWLCCDLPRAHKLDQLWPTARELADQIAVDRDRVVIDERLSDVASLLRLQLDREVNDWQSNAPVSASMQWLIVPVGQTPPPGFVPRSILGDCKLLRRDSTPQSTLAGMGRETTRKPGNPRQAALLQANSVGSSVEKDRDPTELVSVGE